MTDDETHDDFAIEGEDYRAGTLVVTAPADRPTAEDFARFDVSCSLCADGQAPCACGLAS